MNFEFCEMVASGNWFGVYSHFGHPHPPPTPPASWREAVCRDPPIACSFLTEYLVVHTICTSTAGVVAFPPPCVALVISVGAILEKMVSFSSSRYWVRGKRPRARRPFAIFDVWF